MSQQNLTQLVDRLERVVERLEKASLKARQPGGDVGASEGEIPPSVADYDDFLSQHLTRFMELSQKLGGDAAKIAEMVSTAFHAQRDFILLAARCKKPSSPENMQHLLEPTSRQLQMAADFSQKLPFKSEFINHAQACSAGLQALGWVLIEKTPAPYVKEMLASSQFYSNKVLMAYKNKDPTHVEWVKSFNNVITELEAYVKRNHLTGLVWNPNGADPMTFSASTSTTATAAPAPAPAPAEGGIPPPPPPPPASFMDDVKMAAEAAKKKPDTAALFSQINQGEAVTAGLKHVTKDMKTKNRPKDDVAPVVSEPKKKEATPTKPAAQKKGNPKFSLDGNKWSVEYQDNNKEIVISETELRQTVYIYRCDNSVVQIKGKVNAITIDECTKCGIVFDNAVSSCDIVNCKSVEVQCTGKVPNISIDKCSGVQLYISKEGMDVSVVTSKSDQMNIIIPKGDDIEESPIPEQFITKYDMNQKKWITTTSSHV